jgi:uncharacterized protein (TIGR00369 family)
VADQERKKVIKKQENSKNCFVCGLKNAFGLHAEFFEVDQGEVRAVFTPGDLHQGYPGRLHGGLAASVLDEAIGRAANAGNGGTAWYVTVELSLKYRKPIPLGERVVAVGRITKNGGRFFEGTGEILLADGSVAVEANARYMNLPLEKIADFDAAEQEWRVTAKDDDPTEL